LEQVSEEEGHVGEEDHREKRSLWVELQRATDSCMVVFGPDVVEDLHCGSHMDSVIEEPIETEADRVGNNVVGIDDEEGD
jgi:hypothetical protein